MTEVRGDIWDYHRMNNPICITTNGMVKQDGHCVMGRGTAAQAKKLYPELPLLVGRKIKQGGNHVYFFPAHGIYTFPVKHAWFEKADMELIEQSCRELVAKRTTSPRKVYLVRPGCGNGELVWENVKPIIASLLDDRFVVVQI